MKRVFVSAGIQMYIDLIYVLSIYDIHWLRQLDSKARTRVISVYTTFLTDVHHRHQNTSPCGTLLYNKIYAMCCSLFVSILQFTTDSWILILNDFVMNFPATESFVYCMYVCCEWYYMYLLVYFHYYLLSIHKINGNFVYWQLWRQIQ